MLKMANKALLFTYTQNLLPHCTSRSRITLSYLQTGHTTNHWLMSSSLRGTVGRRHLRAANWTHFREERVEAVDFLLFLYKSVILWDAFQRQLIHQVDLVRVVQVLPLEQVKHNVICLSWWAGGHYCQSLHQQCGSLCNIALWYLFTRKQHLLWIHIDGSERCGCDIIWYHNKSRTVSQIIIAVYIFCVIRKFISHVWHKKWLSCTMCTNSKHSQMCLAMSAYGNGTNNFHGISPVYSTPPDAFAMELCIALCIHIWQNHYRINQIYFLYHF